jgi:uncharacterized protein (DUF305 family)
MQTKQFLLAAALAAAAATAGAHAQETTPSDEHQQHHPAPAAKPNQPAGESADTPSAGQGTGPAQPGASGMAMMGPMMMRMMGGDMLMGRGSMMEGAVAPGVTIINMHGMPMMGAQAGSQGTAGSMDMGGQGRSAMPGMGAATGTEGAAQGAAMQAYVEAMVRMHRDMAVSVSGDPDADFARMMIPHHQGAIAMAQVELRYGKDPAIRKLAEDVVRAQEAEIATLRQWLAHQPQ